MKKIIEQSLNRDTNNLYLLVDGEYNLIVYCTQHSSIANYLAAGLLDCKIKVLKTAVLNDHMMLSFKNVTDIGIELFLKNDENTIFKLQNNLGVEEIIVVNKDLITSDLSRFYELKNLAKIRGQYFEQIENILKTSLTRFDWFMTEDLSSLHFAIDSSIPSENQYSLEIQEYARILEISPEYAYNEIKMLITSRNLAKIRTIAIFEKYAKLLNDTKTYEEAHVIFMNLFVDVFHKAAI